MRVLMIVALTMFLTACAGAPQKYSATTPAGQVILDQSVATCRYEAEAGSLGAVAGAQGAIEIEYRKIEAKKSLFKLCMKAKGWEVPIGSS